MGRLNTLCWICKKSCGGENGCSWFNGFKPVPGWKAIETKLKVNPFRPLIKSYKVICCPQFEKDNFVVKKTQRQQAKGLGISVRTLQRRIKKERRKI